MSDELKVFTISGYATAVIEAEFCIVARTEEEARALWKGGHYNNYYLPVGVEDWLHIDHNPDRVVIELDEDDEQSKETLDDFDDFNRETLDELLAELEEEAA